MERDCVRSLCSPEQQENQSSHGSIQHIQYVSNLSICSAALLFVNAPGNRLLAGTLRTLNRGTSCLRVGAGVPNFLFLSFLQTR